MSSPSEKKPEEPKRRNAQFPQKATAAASAAAPNEAPAVDNRGPPQYSSGEDDNNDEDRRSPKSEGSISPERDIEVLKYSPTTSDIEEDAIDANRPPAPDGAPPKPPSGAAPAAATKKFINPV